MAKQLNVSLAFQADISGAQANLNKLKTSLNEIASIPLGNNASAGIKEAVEAAKSLQRHLLNAYSTKTGNLDLSKFNASLKQSNTSLTTLSSSLLKAGMSGERAFLSMHKALSSANIQINKSQGMVGQLINTFTNTVRWQLASSAIHGIVKQFNSAISYAKGLDESLNNIRIRTGQSKEEMAEFAEYANRAAKALNTTTKAYSDAALIYYQQGLDDEQVKARTDITVKMANVTRDSAETVSQQLTAVWNNFDKGGQKLEYIADVMNALGAATASSTSEIATGLQKFAAAADAAGLSYEYAASALATITATTRQSADTVGTGLRTVLARIESLKLGETLEDGVGLTKYTQALEAIGVQVLDTNGQLRKADQILEDMASKWSNLTEAQKMATAETVGGIRQYTTIMALMENWDFMQKNLDVAYNSSGTLQEQADIYAESWEAATKKVKANLEALYGDLIPTDAIIGATNAFADFIGVIDTLVKSFGGLKSILLLFASLLIDRFSANITNSFNLAIQKVTELGEKLKNVGSFSQFMKDKFFFGGSGTDQLSIQNKINNGYDRDSREQMASLQGALDSKAPMSEGFLDQVRALKQINEIQNAININSKNLTAEEKEKLSIQLQQLQVMSEQRAEAAQMLSDQKYAAENLEYSMAEEYYGNGGIKEVTSSNGMAAFGIQLQNTIQDVQYLEELLQNTNTTIFDVGNGIEIWSTDSEGILNAQISIANELKNIAVLNEKIKAINTNDALTHKEKVNAIKEEIVNAQKAGQIHETTAKKLIQSANAPEKMGRAFGRVTAELKTYGSELNASNDAMENAVRIGQKQGEAENKLIQQRNQYNNLLKQTTTFLSDSLSKVGTFGASMTGMISSLTNAGMAISTISNALNTITDPDASGMQKLVSVTMALGAAMRFLNAVTNENSIAMTALNTISAIQSGSYAKLIALTGSKVAADQIEIVMTNLKAAAESGEITRAKIYNALKDMGIAKEKAYAAAKLIYTTYTKLSTAATEGETKAKIIAKAVSEALQAMLSKEKLIRLAVVAVIAIAIVAIMALINAHKKEIEAHKEAAEASKERADALKQEIDANKELIDSYQQAQEAFDGTVKTKAELEDAARKVAAAYGVENTAILLQQGNYEGLTKAINEARLAELERLRVAQQTAQNDAGAVFADSMHSFGDTYNRNISNGRINTHIETGGTGLTSVTQEAIRRMGSAGQIFDFVDEGNIGDEIFGSDLIARAEDTSEGFQQIYESYSKLRDMIADMAGNQGIDYQNDILYKNLNTWLQDHKEAYEAYVASVEAINNTHVEASVLEALTEAESTPKTEEEFSAIYDVIIEKLNGAGIKGEEAKKSLDAYFSSIADADLKNLYNAHSLIEDIKLQLKDAEGKDGILTLIEGDSNYSSANTLANINWALIDTVEEFKEAYAAAEEFGIILDNLASSSSDIEKVADAVSLIKDNMTEQDYTKLYESIEWGKNGIIDFTSFLEKTVDEQKEYLNEILSDSYIDKIYALEQQIETTIERGKQAEQWLSDHENDEVYQGAKRQKDAWDQAAQALMKYRDIDLGSFESDKMMSQYYDGDNGQFDKKMQQYAATFGVTYDELLNLNKEDLINKISTDFQGLDFEALGIDLDMETLLGLSNEEFADYFYAATGENSEAIAEYTQKQNEATAASEENIEALQAQLAIQKELAAQQDAADFGIDKDYYEDLVEVFQESNEELAQNEGMLIADKEAARDAALRYAKLNNAVDDLCDNYDDYNDVLKQLQKAQTKAEKADIANSKSAQSLRKSLAGLLDTSEDLIDADFMASIDPKDFADAAAGDEDAIQRIRNAFIDAQAEIAGLADDPGLEAFKNKLDELADGAVIDINNEPFLQSLIAARLAAGATAPEIESMLQGMNIDCNVEPFLGSMEDIKNAAVNAGDTVVGSLSYDVEDDSQTFEDTDIAEKVGYHEVVIPQQINRTSKVLEDGDKEGTPVQETRYAWTSIVTPQKTTDTEKKENTVHAVRIKNAHKSAGGNVGSSHKNTPSGGKGGGGGGGGGSKSKPAKTQQIKPQKVDRYKEITDKMDDLGDAIKKTNTQSERLWGKDRLTSMQKANELLKEYVGAYKEKVKQAENFLKIDRTALQKTLKASWVGENETDSGIERITESFGNLEFKFDADGDISNYTEIMQKITDKYNARQAYWANPANFEDADAQERYHNLYVKPMEEQIGLIEEAIKQYEETKGVWEENTEAAQEALRAWQDNNLEMLNYKLELKIDVNESELEKIEYYIDKLSDDFYQMGENIANYMLKLQNTKDAMQIYANQINELNEAYEAGDISQEGYYEALKDINGEMYDQLETLKELDTTMREYFGETLDMGQEELEKYTDNLDHVNDMLDHYKNVMQLLGKETDYEMIGSFLDGIAKNSMNNYLAAKQYYDLLAVERARLEDELSKLTVGTEEYKFKEQQLNDLVAAFNDAEDNMLDKAEEAAEAFKAIWENTIESIKHDFEMLVTGGLGYDFLNSSLDRLETRQDEYLTKTNQLYEMNDLLRKLQADSDKTTNLAAKQRIANFSAEMEQLRDKNELSKLDLDIAKARYQQLLAQIALEEAQNAKSMVRLHRDNEGNYGYMYTADPDKVGEAEDALAKANNDLYNIVLEGTNKYSQLSLELTQQYQDDLAQLNADAMENGWFETKEYYDKLAQLQQEYYNLSLAYAREYNTAYSWLDRLDVSTTGANEAYTQEYRGTILASQELSYWQDMADKMQAATRVAVDNINPLLEGPDSLSSSLGTVEQAVADNVERSNEWTEAVIGEGGLVNALGTEFDQVLDKTNEYLKNHQKALYETIEAYEELAEKISGVIAAQSEMSENGELTPEGLRSLAQEIYDSITFQGYDTGGYTGSWGSSGKLALLHEKELVLNKQDTENLLLSVDILRRLSSALDLQAMSSGLASISSSATINAGSNNLQQDVTIHAEFPNAVDHTEIEMAFDTLINRASQYAGR